MFKHNDDHHSPQDWNQLLMNLDTFLNKWILISLRIDVLIMIMITLVNIYKLFTGTR